MIKNLIFDFGKVLVDYDFMPIVSKFFHDENRKQDFCNKIVYPQYWIDRLDKGEQTFWEVISEMQKQYPEFHDEIQMFGEHYVDFVTGEVPGMRLLLTKLKAEGYKLYGLSNWGSPVYDVMNKFSEIFCLLDGRIISSEEKLIKPDVAIYRRLCEKLHLNPEECLFADDKAVNVEGAKNAGLNAIVFKDAEQYDKIIRSLTH